MRTFIFIAGAPGVGKSTTAQLLRDRLDSPLFEFGWIPEFRNTGTRLTTYREDEALAFENLALVAKNYARHGFKNIIITDLEDKRIGELAEVYADYDYALFTLRMKDQGLLRRVC
ncbi:AAA family ATPase [Sinosporangium album]|uniref:AAA family ATPase n=1 Tax=Sinosporangium album TaxID=504805 RepID=UPI00115FB87B|nr:AAA family ATPase [Sinosporangium album]